MQLSARFGRKRSWDGALGKQRGLPSESSSARKNNAINMRRYRLLVGLMCLLGWASAGFGAEAGHAAGGPPVTPAAPTLFDLGAKLHLPFPIPITNSMLYTWVI